MPLRKNASELFAAFVGGDRPDPEDLEACLVGLTRLIGTRYPDLADTDIQEAASDAITALFEAARGRQDIREPSAWMITVARRRAYDRWKALQRTVPAENPLDAVTLSEEAEDGVLQLIDALGDKQLVARAIELALAADDRTGVRVVVTWLDIYDQTGELPSVRKVQARTGVAHSTVAKALTRFAIHLRRAAED